jgi:hypothetical protein
VSTFLERARALGPWDPEDGRLFLGVGLLAARCQRRQLARHCWPEILAVVEAAGNAHDQRYLHELLDALDALDRKAEDQ